MFDRESLIHRITGNLAMLETFLRLQSDQNLNSSADFAEDIFQRLLNLLYGYNLSNANAELANAPAVDLVDPAKRLGVQIAIKGTTSKIRELHRKASEHNLDDDFDKIILLFLVNKAPAKPAPSASFTPCTRPAIVVSDLSTLLGDIRGLDVATMTAIADLLDSEIRNPAKPWSRDERFRPANLPYASLGSLFKGGESTLSAISTSLASATTTVIHGVGGVGKTRTAIEYAWQHAADYRALLFVSADTSESLDRNLGDLCGPLVLNLPEQHEKDKALRRSAALKWLEIHPGWLLIIDDVNSEEAASVTAALLDNLSSGHVLITSRLGNWPDRISVLELEGLSERYFSMRMPGADQTDGRAMQDQACGRDSMGRAGMISALGDFISSALSYPPLSVTIEAPWGEGKSSALVQLRDYLKKSQQGRTVWFNPWRYTEAEALWSGFLAEFTEQMQEGKWIWERFMIQIKYLGNIHGRWILLKCFVSIMAFPVGAYLSRAWLIGQLPSTQDGWIRWFIDIGAYMVAWGPMIFIGLKLWLVFRKPVRTFVGELKIYLKKPDYAASRSSSERLHREFRAWLNACLKPHERVYVFIDDLDRCPGPRAAELLEWLQLMMSNTGEDGVKPFPVVVVSGLDREKVAAAIAMRHADVLPILVPAETAREKAEAAITWGYEYLEKFVDLPVRLPPGSPKVLEAYLQDMAPGAFMAEKQKREQDLKRASESSASKRRSRRKFKDVKADSEGAPLSPMPADNTSVSAPDDGLEDARIPALLRAAAVWLNHSPRRLKHFLNLLRLRWAIRKKMPPDRMTLELTARLVLLETAVPTLFRALADIRFVRETVFERMDDESDGVFRSNGKWNSTLDHQLFAADKIWLGRYGFEVLVNDWEDILHEGPPMHGEESNASPLTLEALNALIDGMPM